MGMDVLHYKVEKTLTYDQYMSALESLDLSYVHVIPVNARVESWMQRAGIPASSISERTEFDWDSWITQNSQYASDEIQVIDHMLDGPDQKFHWIHFQNTVTNESILIDNADSAFPYHTVRYLYLQVDQVGYARKPFRHSDTPPHQVGDALVITVTNFSDKGKDAYGVLAKIDPDGTAACNVHVFDRQDLINLSQYTCDPSYFKKAMVDGFTNDHFVLFNW